MESFKGTCFFDPFNIVRIKNYLVISKELHNFAARLKGLLS
jgi:hypothetical protein